MTCPALRRSSMGCEGINILLCGGEVAFETVFQFKLHVIPRYAGDGWSIQAESHGRERKQRVFQDPSVFRYLRQPRGAWRMGSVRLSEGQVRRPRNLARYDRRDRPAARRAGRVGHLPSPEMRSTSR